MGNERARRQLCLGVAYLLLMSQSGLPALGEGVEGEIESSLPHAPPLGPQGRASSEVEEAEVAGEPHAPPPDAPKDAPLPPEPKFEDCTRAEGHKVSVARYYKDVHQHSGSLHKSMYLAYDMHVNFAVERYKVMDEISEGTYARVFNAWDSFRNMPVVVKAMIPPISLWRVKREIRILSELQGGPNIIQIFDLIHHNVTKLPAMVIEKMTGTLREVNSELKPDDVRHYMYQILRALDFMHARGYMHRDIKASNILVDHATRAVRLADFNVAERYQAGEQYTIWVMSPGYRAPELLVNMEDYDYSLDMWGFGVMLGKMLLRKSDLFNAVNENVYDQLKQFALTLGTESLYSWMDEYGIVMDPNWKAYLGDLPKKPWSHFVTTKNHEFVNGQSLDLLDKLLVFDHQKRLSAKEAMQHPYFDRVRPPPAPLQPPKPYKDPQ